MSLPVRQTHFDPNDDDAHALVRTPRESPKPLPSLGLAAPVILDANRELKLVDQQSPPPGGTRRDTAVLRGLKDLQQLQKQTIAVLEAVKGNLEDIRQVLRSPEATRGMEKQQNAAALLSKGFASEAAEQAEEATRLLPANPDAHLLLSLSLAANQQFDASLAAARKGLALFDRNHHPMAIEAGLLHAVAALGHGPEALTRWQELIDRLPLSILLEQIGRIALCFPGDAPDGTLDTELSRRIITAPFDTGQDPKPGEWLHGLDLATEYLLGRTHRAVLARIATLCLRQKEPSDVVRFLGDYVIPLSERKLTRSSAALGISAVKKLMSQHADAMTLHRAMLKLDLAAARRAQRNIAKWLWHWRLDTNAGRRSATIWTTAILLVVIGATGVAGPLFTSNPTITFLAEHISISAIQITGAILVGLGGLMVLANLFSSEPARHYPEGRPALSREEKSFLARRDTRSSLKKSLAITAAVADAAG